MSRGNLRVDFTKIKRGVAAAAICAAGYILQCTFCGRIALGCVKPNLLIVVTASFGFMRGKEGGMLAGFFSGLLCDIQSGAVIGLYALIYMLIGFANGMARRMFFGGDLAWAVILAGISDLVYGAVVYLLTFMLRGEFGFIYYLMNIIIPEALYTAVAALFVCPLIFYALGGRKV